MRRSLFGPLTLIAFGLLLLADNLIAGYSAWTPLLDHWPWLLVLWGVVHLQQQVFAHANGRRGPSPLGAGAVLVALLLCVGGLAGRKIRANDGVLFRGFGVRVQVRDEGFRSHPPAPPAAPRPAHESP